MPKRRAKTNKILGKNAVTERLNSGGGFIRIELLSGTGDRRIAEIVQKAKRAGVSVRFCDRKTLDAAAEGGKHQGCIGYATDFAYAELPDILAEAGARGEPPFILVLDGIEDPHNLGSIIRTAECGGVHGIVIGKNRQVAVTDTVIKVAAGATEYVKVARVTNVNDAIRELKERGVWVYALDMDGQDLFSTDLSGAIALVVGAEGKGVKPLTKKLCDGVLSLPMKGKINSLNAAVAAAVAVYGKIAADRK